jgi:hypothetical protein
VKQRAPIKFDANIVERAIRRITLGRNTCSLDPIADPYGLLI